MERAPWHMANLPLVLKHWQPSLPLDKEDVFKIPVWVRLFNVPFEYWTPKGLSYVASAVGCPLHADHITLSRKRLSYARVCVEIDARDKLIRDFDFQCSNGMWIRVKADFEWIPMRCDTCRVFGHSLSSCPRDISKIEVQKTSKVWVPKATTASNIVSDSNIEKNEDWIIVSSKKKGKDVVKANSIEPLKILVDQDQAIISGEGSSRGKEVATFDKQEEGECTPCVTPPIATFEEVAIVVNGNGEIKEEAVVVQENEEDCDSPFSNVNSLAAKAKDSLEKKKPGPSGKNKNSSGGKKGRKRHSPRGSRWR